MREQAHLGMLRVFSGVHGFQLDLTGLGKKFAEQRRLADFWHSHHSDDMEVVDLLILL